MPKKYFITLFVLCILLIPGISSFAAGGKEDPEPEDPGLKVFVSILPQEYFVQRIGGSTVSTSVLVPPGKSPHSYEPAPKQVLALGEADVLFTIGVDFEKAFVPEIESGLPELRIVNTRKGIKLREMEDEDHYGHEEYYDPHVWLGLSEAKIIAGNIRETLAELQPEYRDLYKENYADFVSDVDALYKELSESLALSEGKTFLVFHPAFGYFADTFGLRQEAVETGGDEPTPQELEKIIQYALDKDIRVVFVQPQFSRKSAETIAGAINGAVVPLNSLAPNWLENMRSIAENIRKGLNKE